MQCTHSVFSNFAAHISRPTFPQKKRLSCGDVTFKPFKGTCLYTFSKLLSLSRDMSFTTLMALRLQYYRLLSDRHWRCACHHSSCYVEYTAQSWDKIGSSFYTYPTFINRKILLGYCVTRSSQGKLRLRYSIRLSVGRKQKPCRSSILDSSDNN